MCLGLAGAALDAAEAAADATSRAVLEEEFASAAADWLSLREDLARGVRAADGGAPQPLELVRVRLEAALLTGRATRLEQKVVGGRGYALASDTSRRAREAAFLPVQSPTETHLRHLLARAGRSVPSARETGERG
jgi:alkylation response protein AidB-like acyl-CoA dehydrogenase